MFCLTCSSAVSSFELNSISWLAIFSQIFKLLVARYNTKWLARCVEPSCLDKHELTGAPGYSAEAGLPSFAETVFAVAELNAFVKKAGTVRSVSATS